MTENTDNYFGLWQATSGTLAGEDLSADIVAATVLEISNGKYNLNLGGVLDSGSCQIDVQSESIRMTINGLAGPNKGKTFLAIAELIDANVLLIAYDLSGKNFPESFDPKLEANNYVARFKRIK